MSVIEHPTKSEPIGEFGGLAYVRHQGWFVGQTQGGSFAVPYEISAPKDTGAGNRTCVFEPPHITGGTVARNATLGTDFLFGKRFFHAAVGYSNLSMRILNPRPDPHPQHTLKIKGRPVTVLPPVPGHPGEVTDTNILRQFALALRQNPPACAGPVERLYAAGFSASGEVVHEVYQPFGHKLFDLTFACAAPYRTPVKISGQKPIIVFNTEADFDPCARPDDSFSAYRWYVVAGGAHIPDAVLTRLAFPGSQNGSGPPRVAGTSPLNWLPIIRGLFMAGDQWARVGKQPPPSATLEVNAHGQLKRDAVGNALGGIRHPALVAGECRFLASVTGCNGWRLFGGYDSVRRITDAEFPQYLNTFAKATEALLAARFLLPAGRDRLLREAQSQRPDTYTLNYQAGRLLK